ncbi:hypothetical protein ACJJTC_001344 [Scirpophaga incertulas]
MACNSCTRPFTLFRKEVCAKCENSNKAIEKKHVQPPDAYFKNLVAKDESHSSNSNAGINNIDEQLQSRLQNLKDDKNKQVSDKELQLRLANLKGVPNTQFANKPLNCMMEPKTEEEQANELMKQYMLQAKLEENYKIDFDKKIFDIQTRIKKLRSNSTATTTSSQTQLADMESEDEDTEVNKLIEKLKVESLLSRNVEGDTDFIPPIEELPYCEICNEDARMRCLGCRYLFCKRCYIEHKDDDDGCNNFEPYQSNTNTGNV